MAVSKSQKDRMVTASLTVNFQDPESSSDGFLVLEVDDREEGLNKGNTSFPLGSNVGILLFQEANVELTTGTPFSAPSAIYMDASGQIKDFNDAENTSEYITVTNSSNANLGHPANSGSCALEWVDSRCYNWKGEQLSVNTGFKKYGAIESEVVIEFTSAAEGDGEAVPIEVVGVLKAQYSSSATGYWLKPSKKDVPIYLVFASGMKKV